MFLCEDVFTFKVHRVINIVIYENYINIKMKLFECLILQFLSKMYLIWGYILFDFGFYHSRESPKDSYRMRHYLIESYLKERK